LNLSEFVATATDNIDGPITPTCTLTAIGYWTLPLDYDGNVFSRTTSTGEYEIWCYATDTAGNEGSASFSLSIKMIDNYPPNITIPNDIIEGTTDPNGKTITYTVTVYDFVDGPLTPICTTPSGSTFAIGSTTVTCTATDSAGNTATASFTITVYVLTTSDTTPPVITVPGPQTYLTDGPYAVDYSNQVSAIDDVDGAITPSCTPAVGYVFPLGDTRVTCTATDKHCSSGFYHHYST